MIKDIKQKLWHIALTALGVGLAAALSYLLDLVKAHTG
jgi:hypothetical protein